MSEWVTRSPIELFWTAKNAHDNNDDVAFYTVDDNDDNDGDNDDKSEFCSERCSWQKSWSWLLPQIDWRQQSNQDDHDNEDNDIIFEKTMKQSGNKTK